MPYHCSLHATFTVRLSFVMSVVSTGTQCYRSRRHVFVGFVIFDVFLCSQGRRH